MMKKKIITSICIISVIVSCITTAFAGTLVNTGPVREGSRDGCKVLYETEVREGRISEERLYEIFLTGAFSPSVVAQILDDGYATQYAEALKAAGRLAPDYKTKGKQISVTTNTELQTYAPIFDAEYYLKAYPELAKTVGTEPMVLLNHFITVGIDECRQGSEEFNVIAYAQKNPDLFAAYGMNARQYYVHYLTCGKAEGRIAK